MHSSALSLLCPQSVLDSSAAAFSATQHERYERRSFESEHNWKSTEQSSSAGSSAHPSVRHAHTAAGELLLCTHHSTHTQQHLALYQCSFRRRFFLTAAGFNFRARNSQEYILEINYFNVYIVNKAQHIFKNAYFVKFIRKTNTSTDTILICFE